MMRYIHRIGLVLSKWLETFCNQLHGNEERSRPFLRQSWSLYRTSLRIQVCEVFYCMFIYVYRTSLWIQSISTVCLYMYTYTHIDTYTYQKMNRKWMGCQRNPYWRPHHLVEKRAFSFLILTHNILLPVLV